MLLVMVLSKPSYLYEECTGTIELLGGGGYLEHEDSRVCCLRYSGILSSHKERSLHCPHYKVSCSWVDDLRRCRMFVATESSLITSDLLRFRESPSSATPSSTSLRSEGLLKSIKGMQDVSARRSLSTAYKYSLVNS